MDYGIPKPSEDYRKPADRTAGNRLYVGSRDFCVKSLEPIAKLRHAAKTMILRYFVACLSFAIGFLVRGIELRQ